MTFRDYLIATKVEFGGLLVAHPASLQGEDVRGALGSISYILDDLDLAWQAFLTSGGFPRAVFEYSRHGAVSEAYARDLAAWLRADVDPDADTESVPVLLEELTSRMTSPLMNATTVARYNMNYNRNVFELRVRRLLSAHAAIECRQVNDKGRARAGTQSKLYLTDPILSWIPSIVSPGLKTPDMTQLNAIGIALARTIDALDESRWVSGDTIGYARTKSGKEVDLAPVRIPTSSGASMTTPIEGKWVDSGWKGETHTIRNKFGQGIIATESVLDLEGDIWVIPAPAVALLLA